MTLDPQALKAAARAYCKVIGLNYDAISGVLAEKRDEATAAAIRAYQASSIPLVSKLDAETLAELDIQLRKPSSVILPVEREGWQDISTAPTLERVFVAGWQPRSGTVQGYWWFYEDATDENGRPIDHPTAEKWMPLPPPPVGSGRTLADANSKSPIQAREE